MAQINFELQRDSVLTSIKRVHSAQLDLTKPPTGSSRVGSINTSAEALTNALESLLSSQNQIMTTWLQYQSRRMNLMLLMGIFDLDETGRWIDPGNIDSSLLRSYVAGINASQSQDALSGVSQLPTYEQLSAGYTREALEEMGVSDVATVETDGFATSGAATIPAPEGGYQRAQTFEQYAEDAYAAHDEQILLSRARAEEEENAQKRESLGLFDVDAESKAPIVSASFGSARR